MATKKQVNIILGDFARNNTYSSIPHPPPSPPDEESWLDTFPSALILPPSIMPICKETIPIGLIPPPLSDCDSGESSDSSIPSIPSLKRSRKVCMDEYESIPPPPPVPKLENSYVLYPGCGQRVKVYRCCFRVTPLPPSPGL